MRITASMNLKLELDMKRKPVSEILTQNIKFKEDPLHKHWDAQESRWKVIKGDPIICATVKNELNATLDRIEDSMHVQRPVRAIIDGVITLGGPKIVEEVCENNQLQQIRSNL
jgi:hypothetical protein